MLRPSDRWVNYVFFTIYLNWGKFSLESPSLHVLDPERTHAGAGRTCRRHTNAPAGRWSRTWDHHAHCTTMLAYFAPFAPFAVKVAVAETKLRYLQLLSSIWLKWRQFWWWETTAASHPVLLQSLYQQWWTQKTQHYVYERKQSTDTEGHSFALCFSIEAFCQTAEMIELDHHFYHSKKHFPTKQPWVRRSEKHLLNTER